MKTGPRGCMLPFAMIFILLGLTACAPVLVGAAVGTGIYRYQKCKKWVHTAYGDKKVWTCRHYIYGN